MTIARTQTERFGANVFNVEGPIVSGSGQPGPQFALGALAWGEAEAEWVYCKLVLASTTTLQPGQFFQWDKDYNASLLTTSNAVIGYGVGVFSGAAQPSTITGGPIGTLSLAAGTYYIWIQRAGQAPALVSASTTANLVVAETTATAGQANVPASPTASTKQITPISFQAANFTFTATTVNGSNQLTVLGGASPGSGPFLGASISGTGIAGSTTITGVSYAPNGVDYILTMNNNATANGTGITITATGVLETRLMWPYIAKTN